MPSPPVSHYRWLAEYYDDVFTDHLAWFRKARARILGTQMSSVRSACDLACGTGNTAVELALNGLKVTGVDLSPAMCKLARRKARRAGVPLRVIQADMRNFRLPGPVDLFLCEYDALNHVPNAADLRRVLSCVARALSPGGHFYFDVNNRLAFERVWKGAHFVELEKISMLIRGAYDPRRSKGICDVDFFTPAGKLWRRRSERVEQVCWTEGEMRAALRQAGFQVSGIWDATGFFASSAAVLPGCRTFYLARKRG